MGWLNLLLLPVLAALGLFETTAPAAPAPSADEPAKPAEDAPPAAPAKDDDGDEDPAAAGSKAQLKAETARERDRRQAAERERDAARKELDELKSASQSDQDKALSEAKKQATAEERARWEGRAIRAEAKSALTQAGAGDVSVAVAAFLDEHRNLKVNDDGEIDELDKAVKAFKDAHKTLFTARVPSGSADQGAKPPDTAKPQNLEDAITAHYASSRGAPN